MSSTPASILADALTSLTKAANLAFATIEDQAKTDIARANAEVHEARRERDEAVKALHEIQLQEMEWQRRVDGWKNSLGKSDTTIQYQSETIEQLKEEAQQWKGQLVRFEETARKEIQDWKDQFLRAEQERCRLSSRLDELVAEQMALRVQSNGYLQRMSSRKIVAEIPDPSVSSTPRRRPDPTAIAGGSHPLEGAEHNSQVSRKPKVPVKKNIVERARTETLSRPIAHSSSTVTRNTKRTSTTQATEENATAPRPFQVRPASAPRATVSQRELQSVAPRQTVVRRVHAVLEVPIKEESEDENEEAVISDAQSAGSNYEPTPSRRTSLSKNAQQTKARQGSSTKGKQVSRTDEYTDEEEDAIEETVTHARHNRTPRRIEQVSDDEDELILGAETTRPNVYVSLPASITSGAGSPQRAKPVGRAGGTTKKRKLDVDATPRGAAAKLPRKKR